MQTTQTAYFSAYRSLNLNRDAQGVLVVEFHTENKKLGILGAPGAGFFIYSDFHDHSIHTGRLGPIWWRVPSDD